MRSFNSVPSRQRTAILQSFRFEAGQPSAGAVAAELTHAAPRWQNVFDAEILELLMWEKSHELREGGRRL
jgi:hypothetical protein